MKITLKTILTTIAVAVSCHVASAQLIINEIMQSNIDCIMDDLNEFPDSWVELYNAGAETVLLQEYSVCDKNKPEKAYQLPELEVAPGAYVIVYCDKEGTGMHTDFRLDSGKGGSVYLFRNGEGADQIENWKKQPAPNIAYGRKTDGEDAWGYQAMPTPGAANCGVTCKDLLGEPVFSVPGQVSRESHTLSLSLPEDAPEGTVIRYTLDGSEPTETSPVYAEPFDIKATTLVRAKLFCDGYLSPRSTTHSYIHHPRQMTMPVVSIVTDSSYFYGDSIGIYVQGSYSDKPNYSYDWRRPINFEYFDVEGEPSAINQLCETRVKGGMTRLQKPLKSLAVYANKRFGVKRFNYEFFSDQTPGISEFKSIELRNAGNDFNYSYMRDCIIQQSFGLNVDVDWQPSRPAIVYINGVYMGMLNIRPRSNEDNIYSFYDGLEDVDVIENNNEVKEGTVDNFNAFNDFYSVPGHSFSEYNEVMDVSEFCNYMLMNIYFDNKDFPGNNNIMWRPTAEGSRWRWICKDTDFGLGLADEPFYYPTLFWLVTPGFGDNKNSWANKPEHTLLFRNLLEVPEFKDMFIDRAALYLGDFLRPERVNSLIDNRLDAIKGELIPHIERWNTWYIPNKAADMKEWNENRWPFFYEHLQTFFGLGKPIELTVDKGQAKGRQIVINGIPLVHDEFDGKYFQGHQITVQSLSEDDSLYVNGWEVTVYNGQSTTTTTYETETLTYILQPGTKVWRIEIKSILGDEPLPDGITDATIDSAQPCDVYDITGRYVGTATSDNLRSVAAPGVYILRQGNLTYKTIIK